MPDSNGDRRSAGRRRRTRLLPAALLAALVASVLVVTGSRPKPSLPRMSAALASIGPTVPVYPASEPVAPRPVTPSPAAMRAAWRFARRRGGQVSIAVIDTAGRLRGRDGGRRYVCASIVKAMLLVAELQRLTRERLPLDPATEALLAAMITQSDNDAADAIYARVGDAGLLTVASRARMRRLTVGGYWANAQVTAADMARLFKRIRRLMPRRHRRTGLRLLASIVADQRWGLPRAAGSRWRIHFKGGWRATGRGELVHQAAWLHRGRTDLAVAVLTDAQPSQPYAIHTVRGIGDRLLHARAAP